jgi:hypothetical protein
VSHRDVKPANLGIRTSGKNGSEHLVLFDFSSSRADAAALTVGTPPYLDPFLGEAGRDRFDSAAERYAAAVTLFEMATGRPPDYGDGRSQPNTIPDDATVEPEMFDPSVAGPLAAFFRRALARRAGERHHTAGEMLDAWKAIFRPVPRAADADADERAEAARPETALADSGLSARALSAVEQVGAETVADLVAVDRWRLNHLTGVPDATRREINARLRRWREKFAAQVTGRPAGARMHLQPPPDEGGALPDPREAAEMLAEGAGTTRARVRREAARLLLGLDDDPDDGVVGIDGGGVDAFAGEAELADRLDVTRTQLARHLGRMRDAWAADETCRDILGAVGHLVHTTLTASGGVATVTELADAVLAALSQAQAPEAAVGAGGAAGRKAGAEGSPDRIAAGLVRLALDWCESLDEDEAGAPAPLARRRRGGRVVLLARDQALIVAAETIGRRADELVAAVTQAEVPLVPAARAADEVRRVFKQTRDAWRTDPTAPGAQGSGGTGVGGDGPGDEPDDLRLVRLAARLSEDAAASGRGELHPVALAPVTAVRLALSGIASGPMPDRAPDGDRSRGHRLTAQEVRDRVRARFPALAALPNRPELDELLRSAGLPLAYSPDERAYLIIAPAGGAPSGELPTRRITRLTNIPQPLRDRGDQLGRRLADSVASRSFLALGVAAKHLDDAEALLVERFDAVPVDVTGVLLDAMREQADAVGLPWEVVRAADAAAKGSRDAEGLAALVERALPAVDAAVEAASAGAAEGSRPTLLTEAAPLARYGHLARLGRWTDLGVRRVQAVWLLVPQLAGAQEAMIDGRPLPLAAPGQFLMLGSDWMWGSGGPAASDDPARAGRPPTEGRPKAEGRPQTEGVGR